MVSQLCLMCGSTKICQTLCLGARPRYNLVVDEDLKKPNKTKNLVRLIISTGLDRSTEGYSITALNLTFSLRESGLLKNIYFEMQSPPLNSPTSLLVSEETNVLSTKSPPPPSPFPFPHTTLPKHS